MSIRVVALFLLFSHTILPANLFRLFHTTYPINGIDHDCLYRYASTANRLGWHLVPYCIRSIEPLMINDQTCYGTNYTFRTLLETNVSVTDLFDWHAPVDLVTDYAKFLETRNGTDQIFCNCSDVQHFGTGCQYRFAFDGIVFDDIIEQTFALHDNNDPMKRKFDVRTLTDADVTCYLMFNCTTYIGFCLDWRQICDGIRDCTNGHDEENCILMELSECNPQNEYRCGNGMCVPRSFLFDLTMDCMDFRDEQINQDASLYCSHQSSTDCEDHTCGLSDFSCGDGSCFRSLINIETIFDFYIECKSQRNSLYLKHIFQKHENSNLTDDCWRHMWCLLGISCLFEPANITSPCREGIHRNAAYCKENVKLHTSCPKTFFFPPTYFILPFVHLLYKRTKYVYQERSYFIEPIAVCYDPSLCEIGIFPDPMASFDYQKYTCLKIDNFHSSGFFTQGAGVLALTQLATLIHGMFSHCTVQSSVQSSLFQCSNRLLISPHRIYDGYYDCTPDFRDETNASLPCQFNLTDRFLCSAYRPQYRQCIPRRFLLDGISQCDNGEDELFLFGCSDVFDCQYLREFDLSQGIPIIHQELCNIFKVLDQAYGYNDTDETDCEEWPCYPHATRCNGVWNAPNGCDELNCTNTIPYFIAHHVANCSANEHYCLQYNSTKISCLPMSKANDGIIDCLFASDERARAQTTSIESTYLTSTYKQISTVQCWNDPLGEPISIEEICDGKIDCFLGDDEFLCFWQFNDVSYDGQFTCKNGTYLPTYKRCDEVIDCLEAEDEWACDFQNTLTRFDYAQFSIERFSSIKVIFPRSSQITYNREYFFCHRGILIYDRENNRQCLCPPSYYGSRCEYQSERLTISFDMEMLITFNPQTIYQLIFYLLDEEENYLTMETFTYAPMLHASLKHFIALVYPRRNQSPSSFGTLSVRIDGYSVTTNTVNLCLSWLYPVQFSFLPVNRLAVRLLAEERPINRTLCTRLHCKHGICQSFVNSDQHFCQCGTGWTGPMCDHWMAPLNCSQLSRPVFSYGHEMCVCPLGRTGIDCRVIYNYCRDAQCKNGGTCQSLDARTEQHICLCKENYFGDRCQYENARLTFHIPASTSFISVLAIHFLHSPKILPGVLIHHNLYLHKHVQPNSHLLIYDHNQRYLSMIVLAQLLDDSSSFYGSFFLLALLAENRTNLTTSIVTNNRCLHVSERLNSTLMSFKWLKRVKSYHKYFQDVKCFYDEVYMCLVNNQQLPECFRFNHDLANCTSRNYCENNGRCLQIKRSGRLNFVCVCPECIFGSFCQLRMTQFSLTLDSILGETILTDVSLLKQPHLIKYLVCLVVLMFNVGMISNTLSFLTFVDVKIRSTGCGNYLLILSIMCPMTLIVFSMRFTYLLVSQMIVIENKRLLMISCTLFDLILSLFMSLCDWLTACITCERTFNVTEGVHFDKQKSVRMVKFVLSFVIFILILISLHQPFIRTLITDPRDDARFWCVIKFRHSWLQIYTDGINLFNSLAPFLTNLISAIILIVSFSRIKQKASKQMNYTNILTKQLLEEKHLIVSPLVMIVLKLPLIIVMFAMKCVKSDRQIYLIIISYFLSLMPVLTTFPVFIMPSREYRKAFKEKWKKIRGQQ